MGCLTRIDGGGDSNKIPQKGKVEIHLPTGKGMSLEKRTSIKPAETKLQKTILPKTSLSTKTTLSHSPKKPTK